MKFENTKVYGFENATIGMRLPMSKDFADARAKSDFMDIKNTGSDIDLMQRLIKADNTGGQPNSKFLRMIHVQVAITAPLYWWKEADTYKVATVSNSTSTMHKLTSYPITLDCFELADSYSDDEYTELDFPFLDVWEGLIKSLEGLRQKYNETKNKIYWEELIRLLPESWLQTRMFDCNYQTLRNIYRWRKNHRLSEWHAFCKWLETLPFAKELLIS